MNNWIHCNKCYLRYQQTSKFYLTTCGHIKCEKCASALGSEKKCLVCNVTCDVVQLSNNLSPDIQKFFRPYNTSNHEHKQVFIFQYDNAVSLLKKVTSKYNSGKDVVRKQYKMFQELKKQNAKLEIMLKSVRSSGAFAASTPAVGVSHTPMNNSLNITPIGIPSTPMFGQINNPSRIIPWRYPLHQTPGRPQQNQRVNSASSNSYRGLQGPSSVISRKSSGSNVQTPKNPAMISMSRLQFGSNKNSH